MKKRIFEWTCMLFAFGCLTFVGCGSASYENMSTSSYSVMPEEGAYEMEAPMAMADLDSNGGFSNSIVDNVASKDRKIIYESSVTLETKEFDDCIKNLKALVKEQGGYVEHNYVDGSIEHHSRYGEISVRVPVEKYPEFMSSVGEIGSVTYSSEDATDVTSQYVDVKARLSSLEKKMKRLEELEDSAENLTDLLEIENRINDTQYEIESYTAQLKTLDNRIDYCKISISIYEVADFSSVESDTFGGKIADAFTGGFEAFVNVVEVIVVGIVYLIPFIIIIAVIVTVIVLIIRKRKKNKQ